jgi:hypothetical protein
MSLARSLTQHQLTYLALILVGALVCAVVFSSGPFGSDDLVYLSRAIEVSHGTVEAQNYNGSLRFAYNLPAGLSIAVFGASYWSAALVPLLAGLAEIALIYWFAAKAINRRTALIAAALLAFAPLHIHLNGRIHTDAIVAALITATFVLVWMAERSKRPSLFFLAGLCAGGVFWAKELVIVFLLVLIAYPIFARRWSWQWLWFVGGGLVMLIAHLILMAAIAGDPFHGFKVYFMQIDRDFVGGGKESDAFYYFRYLFFDLRHTFLLAPLAVIGLVVWLWRIRRWTPEDSGIHYAVYWGAGLLIVFSFTPLSLDPFQFITKQSNYLNLFLAPLAIVAAYALDRMIAIPRVALLAVSIVIGILLGGLQQQSKRVFTANSKAVAELAMAEPDAWIFATDNNVNITLFSFVMREAEIPPRIDTIASLKEIQGPIDNAETVYAVIDHETELWRDPERDVVADIPDCWEEVRVLTPRGFGLGQPIIEAIAKIPVADRVLAPYTQPKPATLYRIPASAPWCGEGGP